MTWNVHFVHTQVKTICIGIFWQNERMENTPAQRLQNLRKSKGFKRPEDAAQRYGWSVHTYKAHEAGQRGISKSKAVLYADKFGSSPEYILFGSAIETKQAPEIQVDDEAVVLGFIKCYTAMTLDQKKMARILLEGRFKKEDEEALKTKKIGSLENSIPGGNGESKPNNRRNRG